MGSRKLVRDFLLSKQTLFFRSHSILRARSRQVTVYGREFSVFNEFSKKVKGEAQSNQEFQQSIKELKEKATRLQSLTEDLKVRTKQTTEQLYVRVNGVLSDAESTAKKVSADVKEKISAATEEVKETFKLGKEHLSESHDSSKTSKRNSKSDVNNEAGGERSAEGGTTSENSEAPGGPDSLLNKIKSAVSATTPKIHTTLKNLKDARVVDMAKKGYDMVKDELSGRPSMRKRMQQAVASSSKIPKSSETAVVIVPVEQSPWEKKWEAFQNKLRGHPAFKRLTGFSEPVVAKGQELAEDVRERWETSDNPVVHKIQDVSESVFGESTTALSFKEIRRRDPSFSLPEFVAEVQESVRPTLQAYLKGDLEMLRNNCSPEVVERCKAERAAYEAQGTFFDHKLLHISDAEVRETKLMGDTPIIIVAFQTQQIYCVKDRNGAITEGGKDTIHTVYYAWAMQQVDTDESGEPLIYPAWRLREMQQLGVQALI